MISSKAENLVIRNLKIRQSPRWTILVHSSKNVLIHVSSVSLILVCRSSWLIRTLIFVHDLTLGPWDAKVTEKRTEWTSTTAPTSRCIVFA